MVCNSNVLRGFETELPTEAVDVIGSGDEANIGEDLEGRALSGSAP